MYYNVYFLAGTLNYLIKIPSRYKARGALVSKYYQRGGSVNFRSTHVKESMFCLANKFQIIISNSMLIKLIMNCVTGFLSGAEHIHFVVWDGLVCLNNYFRLGRFICGRCKFFFTSFSSRMKNRSCPPFPIFFLNCSYLTL